MSAIGKFVRRDGRLCSVYPLISWVPGELLATLDGEFSAEQLRAMADHIERHSVGRWPWPYLAPID